MEPPSLSAPPSDPQGVGPAVLTRGACLDLLRQQRVGRLGFVADGWPIILPVNYALDGETIVLRSGPGTKLNAVRHGAPAAFEVDDLDDVHRSGRSVLVLGMASEIVDEAGLLRAKRLPLRPWSTTPKDFWIRVDPVQITGRALPKGWRYPDPVQ
jgi:nitroimidazol reductase NimA-like FMN-containing flavoprotein (pyridoxamine 5'-phosphate oxidase superfamily)